MIYDELRYFNADEFAPHADKMNPELLRMLDQVRHLAGVPMVITSAYRDPEHNRRVGGASNSAHLRGTAVDVGITDSVSRYLILAAAIQVGFRRIGVGNSFIHLDVDEELPPNVVWTY